MRKKKNIFLYIGFMLCLVFAVYALDFGSSTSMPSQPESPLSLYDSYIITDETGTRELMRVRIRVHIGDEVLTEDNKLYEVTHIEKDRAYAKYVKQLKL